MTKLPVGWTSACLGDLGCEVRGSVRPEAGKKYELYSVPAFPTRKPEVLDGEDIGSHKRPVLPGDLLLCKINPRINRVWLVGPASDGLPQLASTEYLVLRVTDIGLGRYLLWYFRSPRFRSWIELAVEGATGSHTRAKSGPILQQAVPIPPVGEQDRIVAAIEEQFSRLDQAEHLLGGARRRAERLRMAAMATATSGDWPVKALADVTAKQEYGSSAKASAKQANGVPIVRMGNIQDGQVDLSRDVKYLPPDHPDAARYALRDGDLLFNRTNSPELVGKSAAFRGSPARACFASYLIRVQLDDRCLPEWASLYLNSPSGRRWAASVRSQQVGQANINGSKLAAMPLPLPPVDEQHRILSEFQRQVSLVESATAVVDRALIRAGHLRRAILARAFSGQLVPQDPSDEPAAELLARLRAETSVEPNGSRRRKQP